MTEELLMLYGAKHAVQQMLKDGNVLFSKQLNDEISQTIEFADICNYLSDKIEKVKELENERRGKASINSNG